MFECAAFCGRISVGHTEPPGGVCAKIFYQIDSVCSTFLCVRFHFTMNLLFYPTMDWFHKLADQEFFEQVLIVPWLPEELEKLREMGSEEI